MDNAENKRSAYWDNIKGFLILLVVFAHILFQLQDISFTINGIVDYIYMFHMPAFVFVSGFFGKSEHSHSFESMIKLIFLYFIFNSIIGFIYGFTSVIQPIIRTICRGISSVPKRTVNCKIKNILKELQSDCLFYRVQPCLHGEHILFSITAIRLSKWQATIRQMMHSEESFFLSLHFWLYILSDVFRQIAIYRLSHLSEKILYGYSFSTDLLLSC